MPPASESSATTMLRLASRIPAALEAYARWAATCTMPEGSCDRRGGLGRGGSDFAGTASQNTSMGSTCPTLTTA